MADKIRWVPKFIDAISGEIEEFETGRWTVGPSDRRTECRFDKKMKVVVLKFSIVEIVPTPDDNIFCPSPAFQRPYNAKIQKIQKI